MPTGLRLPLLTPADRRARLAIPMIMSTIQMPFEKIEGCEKMLLAQPIVLMFITIQYIVAMEVTSHIY